MLFKDQKVNILRLVVQTSKENPNIQFYQALVEEPDFFMLEDSAARVSVNPESGKAFIESKAKAGTYVCDVKITKKFNSQKQKVWAVSLDKINLK